MSEAKSPQRLELIGKHDEEPFLHDEETEKVDVV